jgi:RHS repeat-associated protein
VYDEHNARVRCTGIRPSSTLIYLHSDHLGSISVATNSAGGVLSSQEYDPWGKIRSGGVPQTKLNYTAQKRDDTGLLYYNARYYDPVLGRFVSPDSIVPGASSGAGGAGGTVGAWQKSNLTVD